MVLNTSFNVKGQPIVNTPREAMETFLGTGIEYLFLENILVRRRESTLVLNARASRRPSAGATRPSTNMLRCPQRCGQKSIRYVVAFGTRKVFK